MSRKNNQTQTYVDLQFVKIMVASWGPAWHLSAWQGRLGVVGFSSFKKECTR